MEHTGQNSTGSAYLFVHFREKKTPDGEQVYFGLSRDGFHWEKVNDGAPVLWSFLGEKGVRDFTITYCEHTKRYYILATDLSLAYNMKRKYQNSWEEVNRNGSSYLVLWESEDLVHWSEQRMIKMGEMVFGSLWAPDVLYDRKTGEYVVHWSGSTEENDFGPKAIYCSRTKDFAHFTEPELLYRKKDGAVIDSAMYEEDGSYYLFVKSMEAPCGVILLTADQVTGPFSYVTAFDESKGVPDAGAYEAPTAVQLDDGTWCLFLDYFGVPGAGQGYVPFLARHLAGGDFQRADRQFSFPYGYKHGTILKITMEDYERIKAHCWEE